MKLFCSVIPVSLWSSATLVCTVCRLNHCRSESKIVFLNKSLVLKNLELDPTHVGDTHRRRKCRETPQSAAQSAPRLARDQRWFWHLFYFLRLCLNDKHNTTHNTLIQLLNYLKISSTCVEQNCLLTGAEKCGSGVNRQAAAYPRIVISRRFAALPPTVCSRRQSVCVLNT